MSGIEFSDDQGEGMLRTVAAVTTAAAALIVCGVVYNTTQYAPRVCEGFAVLLDGPSNGPRVVIADPLIRNAGPTLLEAQVQPDGKVRYTDSASLQHSAWFTADGQPTAYPRGGCSYTLNGEIAAGRQVNVPAQVTPEQIVNDAVRDLFTRMDAPVTA